MRRGDAQRVCRRSALNKHSADGESLRHCGACAVLPEIRDPEIPEPEPRGDALIQQIAGEHAVKIIGTLAALFHRQPRRLALQAAFSRFIGILAAAAVVDHQIKAVLKRPFALFFADHRGACGDNRRVFKHDCSFSHSFYHKKTSANSFSGDSFIIRFDTLFARARTPRSSGYTCRFSAALAYRRAAPPAKTKRPEDRTES